MKLFFSLLLLTLSVSSFAGSPMTLDCKDELGLYEEVVGLVNDEKAMKEMEMKGVAEVTFTISEDHTIHVVQVVTKDQLFEFHIRQKLEGIQVDHCFETNHPYTILVNAKLI